MPAYPVVTVVQLSLGVSSAPIPAATYTQLTPSAGSTSVQARCTATGLTGLSVVPINTTS